MQDIEYKDKIEIRKKRRIHQKKAQKRLKKINVKNDDIPTRQPRKIGYARVSTKKQDFDLQMDALKAAGIHDEDIFTDKMSGKSTVRPGLERCKKFLIRGDTLVVWRLDRLGRSIVMLKNLIDGFVKQGVTFVSLREHIDLSTSSGRAMFGMMGVFAEMEREVISERVHQGIKAKKESGEIKEWGRKISPDFDINLAKTLLREGKPERKIAKMLGVSKTKIHSIKKEMKNEPQPSTI